MSDILIIEGKLRWTDQEGGYADSAFDLVGDGSISSIVWDWMQKQGAEIDRDRHDNIDEGSTHDKFRISIEKIGDDR